VWVNVREAARLLGLHYNTVVRLPPEDLPYMVVRARGDRRYRVTDIDAYIERRMVRVSDELLV